MARPRKDKVKLQTWISAEIANTLESTVKRSGQSKTDLIEKLLRIGIETEQQKAIKLYNSNAFDVLPTIADKSIPLVILDLPYQATKLHWDKKIDLSKLWFHLERILTNTGTVIMFGSGIFTAELILSNSQLYKYTAHWCKNRHSNFLKSGDRLSQMTEDIIIFSKGVINHKSLSPITRMTYNPIHITPLNKPKQHKTDRCDGTVISNKITNKRIAIQLNSGYSDNLIFCKVETGKKRFHPTQKPIQLLDFLIQSFSNSGDVVADFFFGSGSTAIASFKCGRRFIGSELDNTIFNTAMIRIQSETGLKIE